MLLLYSSSQHLFVGVASALSAVVSCALPVVVAAALRTVSARDAVGVTVCVAALLAVGRWQVDSRVRSSGLSAKPRHELAGVALAAISGVAMSAYYLALAGSSPRVQLGEAVESRIVAALLLTAVALVIHRRALLPGTGALLTALPVTLTGLLGALCYAAAVTANNLPVIVPIVSMSPMVTVAAAWIILGERISPRQLGALGLAMVGIVVVTV